MNKLTEALRAAGLTQAQAAELLGVHRTTIADKARGDVKHVGDLLYLVASWSVLTESQHDDVRRRLAELVAD